MRGRLVVIAAIAFAAAASGCGGGSGRSGSSGLLDTTVVARAIATSIRSQHHVKAHVSCPTGVPRKAGTSFTCTARLQVGSYPVFVTVTKSSGHVRYGNAAPLVILDTPRVEASIRHAILVQRRLHANVSCPSPVLQQAGLSFTCTATVGSRRFPFVVTQTNGSGHVRYVGVR